ncbi:MAG: hypothetical protein GC154_21855 [bacterium]|nr:hypothetical protein [bacterium]
MRMDFKWIVVFAICLMAPMGWSATSNTGNNPTFLIVDVVTNNFTTWSPDTIDIGIDAGADGVYDYWVSKDKFFAFSNKKTSGSVNPSAWATLVINLDKYAGQQAKIKIVDKSSTGFIAINSIRLNFADGSMVPNGVPNGFFEETPALTGWTVTGSLSAADLIKTDNALAATTYGTHYLSTTAAGTAEIESNVFTLTPISSFIYGVFGGPASSYFDKPGAFGDDENGLLVYVDMGTPTQDPNGQYDAGTDIPLTGFLFRGPDDGLEVSMINTSGYEGNRAQFVVADLTESKAISFDCIRMNFDNSIIRNGGFEEGFENGVPDGFDGQSVRIPSDHPAGKIPGWSMNHITLPGRNFDPESTFVFFGKPAGGYTRSGYVWVGTGTFDFGDSAGAELQAGVEMRSDVFVIQPIPDAGESVFMSFNSGQAANRIDQFATDVDPAKRNAVELQVDVDGNGAFDDSNDFIYPLQNQGMAWAAEEDGEVDVWHYPEYRFYIADEHQGKSARVYAEDTTTGGWAWMAVDDFYFWTGSKAQLAFDNSDFEHGDMTNWNEDELSSGFTSWLASNSTTPVAPAVHTAMNGINTWLDGSWSADSAPREVASGDDSTGKLWSNTFTIPTLDASSNVMDWPLMQ